MPALCRKILIIIAFAAVLCSGFLMFITRAPARTIPPGRNIVSPANGRLIAVTKVDGPDLTFFKDGLKNILAVNELNPPVWILLVEMNLKDVHVQRSPIDGVISRQQYFPGKFKNVLTAKNKSELVNLNEKMLTIIKGEGLSVGVIQVAGQAARRIKSDVKAGQSVLKGEIFGRITLGSQVVLLLPGNLELKVQAGQKVVDGETIVAEY